MSLSPQPELEQTKHTSATLGRYSIVREIACGGMATVYLAKERTGAETARLVAIKCCHPHLRRDPTFAAMFLDEARLAASIHHPNVVAILEIGEPDPLYFAMEYIDGASLAEWLKHSAADRSQRISVGLLLRIMLDALTGLHAAHELRDESAQPLRLVHRDISPQNLLIGLDGTTRIADFGIAKAEKRATRTRTGQVKGKTGYMPPEQILGEPIDRRADVYAAGVVLWEALVGRRLFDAESDAAVINQVLNGRIPAPSSLSDVPRELDPIVEKALRYRPDDRFATALEFAEALQATALEISPAQEVGKALSAWLPLDRNHSQRALPQPPARPRTKTGRALLAVLLVLAAALLVLCFRPWRKRAGSPAPMQADSLVQQAAQTPPLDSLPLPRQLTEQKQDNPLLKVTAQRDKVSSSNRVLRPASARPSATPTVSTVHATPAAHDSANATRRSNAITPQPSSTPTKPSSRKPAEFRPQDL